MTLATRQKKPATPDDLDVKKEVEVTATSLEDSRRQVTKLVTSPAMAALRAIEAVEGKNGYGKYLDTPELLQCLRDQSAAVKGGDLALAEAMLINQATTLQSLFSRLVERGMCCDHYPGFESNLRMALRAQSQCRATLETLATIKNPPVVFARQANVTTGPQQINNGTAVTSRALENESKQTQLSRSNHELLANTGASSVTSGIDPAMATVGEIHRAEVGSG